MVGLKLGNLVAVDWAKPKPWAPMPGVAPEAKIDFVWHA